MVVKKARQNSLFQIRIKCDQKVRTGTRKFKYAIRFKAFLGPEKTEE